MRGEDFLALQIKVVSDTLDTQVVVSDTLDMVALVFSAVGLTWLLVDNIDSISSRLLCLEIGSLYNQEPSSRFGLNIPPEYKPEAILCPRSPAR